MISAGLLIATPTTQASRKQRTNKLGRCFSKIQNFEKLKNSKF